MLQLLEKYMLPASDMVLDQMLNDYRTPQSGQLYSSLKVEEYFLNKNWASPLSQYQHLSPITVSKLM